MQPATILWDVDTQVDFLLPGGKLYVQGAESIIANLGRLTQWAQEHRIFVVGSADAHTLSDPEFQQYPPHCLVGTPGQRKIPETQMTSELIIPNRPVELPANLESYDQVILEKQTVDVFTNPNTDELLQWLGKRSVVLYGVTTDVCVAHAAHGLIERGYDVALVTDAIFAIDAARGRELVEWVAERGQLTTTDQIVRQRAAA